MSESPRGLPVKETIRVKGASRVMAQAMKASVEASALSLVTRDIDVTRLQESRDVQRAHGVQRVSLNTLMMAAVARTLPAHPMLNAELVDRDILIYDTVNLGMAVATPGGLIVAVVPNANALTVSEMDVAIDSLAQRARNGGLARSDVEGGTFTVSNLGMYGVDGGFPIPRTPEGAILLIGAAREKPAVVQGAVTVRRIAQFSLTFDHRYIDGATAAAFLRDLNDLLGDPAGLGIE